MHRHVTAEIHNIHDIIVMMIIPLHSADYTAQSPAMAMTTQCRGFHSVDGMLCIIPVAWSRVTLWQEHRRSYTDCRCNWQ